MKVATLFNLEKQFAFYRHYHTNAINRRIHYVFVPILLTSAFILLAEIRLPAPLEDVSKVITLVYILHGLIMEVTVGLSHMPILLGYYFASRAIRHALAPENVIAVAISMHLSAWTAQLFGHAVFEQRTPAIMGGLVQAVSAAPVVLWLEILFDCGFRPELKARLNRSHVVAKARKAVKAAKS